MGKVLFFIVVVFICVLIFQAIVDDLERKKKEKDTPISETRKYNRLIK